jgi:tetratricopeptide (TPR) repeat protein
MELAWLSWNAQNIPQAVSWLEKHLAIYPNDAAAVRLIADCHSKLGNKAAARRWNEKLLDLAPSRSKLQADAFERLAQFEQALKIVSSLRTTQPEDAALKRQQVRLLLALGRPGDARRALP